MTFPQDSYLVWIGGSCDYGHKERAGAAACIIEKNGEELDSFEIAEFGTTEFRMMLKVMIQSMLKIDEGSDIIFLTNVSYILNFDKTPSDTTANADLISMCIQTKQRHRNVSVRIVQYHKHPELGNIHRISHEKMDLLRRGQNV